MDTADEVSLNDKDHSEKAAQELEDLVELEDSRDYVDDEESFVEPEIFMARFVASVGRT
eukprot:gene19838-21780_t